MPVTKKKYPQARVQQYIIHMLRNSFQYVDYKDLKKFSSDFKAVYNVPAKETAFAELEGIKEKKHRKEVFLCHK